MVSLGVVPLCLQARFGICWTKCPVAGFAARSLSSDIGGNRS